jgi:hypothetical protein
MGANAEALDANARRKAAEELAFNREARLRQTLAADRKAIMAKIARQRSLRIANETERKTQSRPTHNA